MESHRDKRKRSCWLTFSDNDKQGASQLIIFMAKKACDNNHLHDYNIQIICQIIFYNRIIVNAYIVIIGDITMTSAFIFDFLIIVVLYSVKGLF